MVSSGQTSAQRAASSLRCFKRLRQTSCVPASRLVAVQVARDDSDVQSQNGKQLAKAAQRATINQELLSVGEHMKMLQMSRQQWVSPRGCANVALSISESYATASSVTFTHPSLIRSGIETDGCCHGVLWRATARGVGSHLYFCSDPGAAAVVPAADVQTIVAVKTGQMGRPCAAGHPRQLLGGTSCCQSTAVAHAAEAWQLRGVSRGAAEQRQQQRQRRSASAGGGRDRRGAEGLSGWRYRERTGLVSEGAHIARHGPEAIQVPRHR